MKKSLTVTGFEKPFGVKSWRREIEFGSGIERIQCEIVTTRHKDSAAFARKFQEPRPIAVDIEIKDEKEEWKGENCLLEAMTTVAQVAGHLVLHLTFVRERHVSNEERIAAMRANQTDADPSPLAMAMLCAFDSNVLNGYFARKAGKPMRYFDWNKAARLIRERQPKEAEALLDRDRRHCAYTIYSDGEIQRNERACVDSNWDTPTLVLDDEEIECWCDDDQDPDGNTWPETALKILMGVL